ncbi:unnamed protein product [Nippostrongylus brasiliensis]|uniref:C-type lectin domain-containing protein n=1 Tax=Nippostrongylus brasiliensis TaxID=27835 RepID=A0A0N4XH56_NIPBR|nr:unnamed protein product [Nippostrongylus brasiliensis]
MKWNDAARFCKDRESALALTETDDDQTFYAGFVQGSITAAGGPGQQRVTGVWTSVRSVPNGSEPAWVSFPGSFVLSRQFWQPGEPNIYPNYDDVCVSLQEETLYRNWMSESCDVNNYVVCKRKAVDTVASQQRQAQCVCPPGFSGVRCERNAENSPSQSTSCASIPFEFVCRNGGSIIVEFASYGATEGYVCTQNMAALTQTCTNPNSLKTISNKCAGLSYCRIENLRELLIETPCPVAEELYLQYRFTCSEGAGSKSGQFIHFLFIFKITSSCTVVSGATDTRTVERSIPAQANHAFHSSGFSELVPVLSEKVMILTWYSGWRLQVVL